MEYDIAEFLNENPGKILSLIHLKSVSLVIIRFFSYLTVSFNEAQEESNKLEQSVKNGELQNSKIRRQPVTEADNNIGTNLKWLTVY